VFAFTYGIEMGYEKKWQSHFLQDHLMKWRLSMHLAFVRVAWTPSGHGEYQKRNFRYRHRAVLLLLSSKSMK
jgi:hypothetical protein